MMSGARPIALAAVLAAVLVGHVSSSYADNARTPAAALQAGRLAYGHGDYKSAIATLTPLIYPSISLAAEADLVDAYKLLALSFFFEEDPRGASREFENLLELDPNFELDPVIEPPPAVAFFDSVKKRISERLSELREREERERRQKELRDKAQRDKDERLRLAMREQVVITRVERRNNFARNFIPFGVPQFLNGDTGKGTFLLITETVFGGVSFGTWYYLVSKYAGRIPRAESSTGLRLQIVQISAGVMFVGLATWGVIDAIRHFKPVVIEEERRRVVRPTLPPTAEEQPAHKTSKPGSTPGLPAEKPVTFMAPFAVPGGAGLGLGGTF